MSYPWWKKRKEHMPCQSPETSNEAMQHLSQPEMENEKDQFRPAVTESSRLDCVLCDDHFSGGQRVETTTTWR